MNAKKQVPEALLQETQGVVGIYETHQRNSQRHVVDRESRNVSS